MRVPLPLQTDEFFSFTLYPAHSRVGRGNLETKCTGISFPIKILAFPTYYQILEKLGVEWWNLTPHC